MALFSFLFGICAALLAGQVIAGENLLSLYREAKLDNPGILAARAATSAELENIAIARGQLFPSLTATGNQGKSNTDRQIGAAAQESFRYDTYSYGLEWRQPIVRLHSFATYRQAEAQGKAAEARQDQTENDLTLRLVGTYLDVLFAEDQRQLLSKLKNAIRTQMNAAEIAFRAGTGTRIDIDEASSRLDMVLAQELEIENQLQHARRQLGALVGRGVGELAKVDPQLPMKPFPLQKVENLTTHAVENNPMYRGLVAQEIAARREVDKAIAGHFPTLDLVGSTARSTNENLSTLNQAGDSRYKTSSVGLQLSIPLFAGGQVNASVRQAQAKLEQIRQQLEETRRAISLQINRESDNVMQGQTRLKALARAEASAQQTVTSTTKGVQVGIRSTLDVLQVEQQLHSIQRDLAQARYNYLLAGLRLKATIGVINDHDIELLNGYFLPQALH